MCLSTPRWASVVAKMCFLAFSGPYFASSRPRNIRNASAGSSVVPDLETTFRSKSRSPSSSSRCISASGDREFPAKRSFGSPGCGRGRSSSTAPFAPRYDPPMPTTTSACERPRIRDAAARICLSSPFCMCPGRSSHPVKSLPAPVCSSSVRCACAAAA